ncbi:MAG: amidase [Dehalococcoidia bacterium]|nr:amidase [Dehalococcoidia bacterium]
MPLDLPLDPALPPLSDPLLEAPATELARLIREHAVTALEVVTAHLRRIGEVNGQLNAIVRLDPQALDHARAVDAALARGEALGPLAGVPVTVKDWIEVAGLVCDAGYEHRAEYVPPRDAPVVARLREAGAIVVGKSTVTEGAPLHPRPNNPRDLARTPGSSSSGEAAVVASGGSPLGLASDSGGSIRWPAHCCGVAALKPTTGLVPNTGHYPRLGHLSDPRTTIGPLARSARDLEVALRVIAGADPGDPGSVPVPLGDAAQVNLRGLRVAWFVAMPGAAPTPETARTVEEAARALADRGCTVVEAAPPRLAESLPITEGYWARVQSLSFEEWRPPRAPTLSAEAIERGRFEWERFSRSMAAFFEGFDAVLSPVAARPAPEHGSWGRDEYRYTLPWSLTGQPAAVVPFGVSPEGLPIGIQLIARRWRDDVAIALATALEEEGARPYD